MIIQIFLPIITSLALCFFSIPSIIKICKIKKLFDEPDIRKCHEGMIPSLGGIAIFIGFIFSLCFWADQKDIVELQYIICALLLLFFTGIKDDVVNLVAYKKLAMQVLCSFIIIKFAGIYFTSFYGLFGVYNISYSTSFVFTLFVMIGITNAFNLIDGINTLAASIGILSLASFGIWFFLTGHSQYSILSFSLIGSLIAFLYFNKTPARIFMGDTGSLILGFTISILAIKFIEFNRLYIGDPQYKITSVPAVAISVLIIPLFDTLRVFTLRLLKGRSPLSPDREHLHHILKDIGFSDIKSMFILLSLNIFLIILTVAFQVFQGEYLLLMNLAICFLFVFLISKKRIKTHG